MRLPTCKTLLTASSFHWLEFARGCCVSISYIRPAVQVYMRVGWLGVVGCRGGGGLAGGVLLWFSRAAVSSEGQALLRKLSLMRRRPCVNIGFLFHAVGLHKHE